MTARVVVALADAGFDPTEAAVAWRTLAAAGHDVRFATSTGGVAKTDTRMLTGEGLGPFRSLLRADARGRAAYDEMAASPRFGAPLRVEDVDPSELDMLVLPGGHAKEMRPYLESEALQRLAAECFRRNVRVGAICHGVVVLARTRGPDGRSVLYGRRTTALTERQELLAWRLTRWWVGDYYRTYPETVESEVTRTLASPRDFARGPLPVARDAPGRTARGFVVRDGNYVSARWPGDAHAFADSLVELLRG